MSFRLLGIHGQEGDKSCLRKKRPIKVIPGPIYTFGVLAEDKRTINILANHRRVYIRYNN